jgi:hypothetical protein
MKEFKHIVTKTKVEYGDWAIEHILGCTNDCAYCFAKRIASRLWGFEAWTKPILKFDKEKTLKLLKSELEQLANKNKNQSKIRIVLSFMTDPFQPCEKKYRITEVILRELANWEFEIWVLTKSTPLHCRNTAVLGDVDYYMLMANVPNLRYGISVNGLEYDKKWEPNAPSPAIRLQSLLVAKETWNLKTFESIEPIRKNSILPILRNKISLNCCDFFILGKLNPGNQYNGYIRSYMPEVIQFLKENNKPFLIKSELAEVLGLESEQKEEPKKAKRLEDYF